MEKIKTIDEFSSLNESKKIDDRLKSISTNLKELESSSNDFILGDTLVRNNEKLSKLAIFLINKLKATGSNWVLHPTIHNFDVDGKTLTGIVFYSSSYIVICFVKTAGYTSSTIVIYKREDVNSLSDLPEKTLVTISSDKVGLMEMATIMTDIINGGVNESFIFEGEEDDSDDDGGESTSKSTPLGTGKANLSAKLSPFVYDIRKDQNKDVLDAMVAVLKTVTVDDFKTAFYGKNQKSIDKIIAATDQETYDKILQYMDRIGLSGKSNMVKGVAETVKIYATMGVWVDYDAKFKASIKREEESMTSYEEAYEKNKNDYDDALAEIDRVSRGMCQYVKRGHSVDAVDKPYRYAVGTKRGLLICGTAGSGKTYTMQKVFKELGMREGVDYRNWGTASKSKTALYNYMYEYNGKLVVLDDAGDFIKDRDEFWLHLLQPGDTVEAPVEQGGSYYNPTNRSRRAKYRLESMVPIKALTAKEIKAMGDEKYNAFMEEQFSNPKLKRPNKFTFDGCVIIITNLSTADLIKSTSSSGVWSAIKSRFNITIVAPAADVLWNTMKDTLKKEHDDDSMNDDLRIIPNSYYEQFVDFMDDVIINKKYGNDYIEMNWRLPLFIGQALRSELPERAWHKLVFDALQDSEVLKKWEMRLPSKD